MEENVLNDAVDLVLLRRCETQTIEVKAARGGTPRLYDTLSSFSNQAGGGIVVFGIDEDAGYEVCGGVRPPAPAEGRRRAVQRDATRAPSVLRDDG